MLLTEVTDIRSGHRGQVTKGQHMNPFLIGPCDACFMVNFPFPTQWNWLDDHQRGFRLLSGQGQVKIRLRSGLKRSTFKLIFLHIKGIYSMQLITGNPMVVLVVLYVINNGKKMEFKFFTSLILSSFFCHNFVKKWVTKLKFGMSIAVY